MEEIKSYNEKWEAENVEIKNDINILNIDNIKWNKEYVKLSKLSNTDSLLNLFNKDTVHVGYAINESGEIYKSSNYTSSEFIYCHGAEHLRFIYVSENTVKALNNIYCAFYDDNKQFIDKRYMATHSVDVPSAAIYVRLAPATYAYETFMLFSTTNDNYLPDKYYGYMDGENNHYQIPTNDDLENKADKIRGVNSKSLYGDAYEEYVRLQKIPKTDSTLNLFDKDSVQIGYAISADGSLCANGSYAATTEFMKCNGKSYIMPIKYAETGIARYVNLWCAFYNENKEMVGSLLSNASYFSIPSDAYYVRVAPGIQSIDSFMLFATDNNTYLPDKYYGYMDGEDNEYSAFKDIQNVSDTVNSFSDDINDLKGSKNIILLDELEAISTYNTYYITTSGTLSSVGSQYTNFNVREYKIEPNKTYVFKGNARLNGEFPIAGVKDTSGLSGKLTVLLNASTTEEYFYLEYSSITEAYIYIADVTNYRLPIYNTKISFEYENVKNNALQCIVNPWYGKKVVWLGTSVSFGQLAEKSYVQEVANYLGFNLVNASVPGLGIHTNEDGSALTYGSSCLSVEEYASFGTTIADTPVTPYIPGGKYNSYYRTYEHVFCTENADADLYVFDVAPNNSNWATTDWDNFNYSAWSYTDGSDFVNHRTTFLGALLFLMDKMYAINPNARMVFVLGSAFAYDNGKAAFEKVSEKWRIPIIDLWGKLIHLQSL